MSAEIKDRTTAVTQKVEKIHDEVIDFAHRKTPVEKAVVKDGSVKLVLEHEPSVNNMDLHGAMKLGHELAKKFPDVDFNFKHGSIDAGYKGYIAIYFNEVEK